MQKHCINNLEEFLNTWQNNQGYFDMLGVLCQLSRLFSESKIPYLDYRLTENVFCKYFQAYNDARSCTAYDARLKSLGIGIKTFILNGKNGDYSIEKIAEFNKLKKTLNGLSGLDLAHKIGEFRNERMEFANNLYNVTETQYHIVGRIDGALRIFNSPYEKIETDKLHLVKDDETSCSFHDQKNEYTFNKSKSVLMKKFVLPTNYKEVKVEIISDPWELLEQLFKFEHEKITKSKTLSQGVDYVVLPLYSYDKKRGYYVPEKSGLNQFNAGGRKRNEFEVYIPIPKVIHNKFPEFFPPRENPFSLRLPDGTIISAKICQDGGKALMSNPNKVLGEWILKKVLRKNSWEIVTINDLNQFGFDSICIEKTHQTDDNGNQIFSIYFSDTLEDYQKFIDN